MLNTVNVLECTNADKIEIVQLKSFTDDKEGNKQAEELFVNIIKETGASASNENITLALDDGYYEIGMGYVALIHST